SCGDVVVKIPDIAIGLPYDELNQVIVGDVAYRDESLNQLLEEGVHSLNEYTTPRYFIGMKIVYKERTSDFLAQIFVLERLDSNAFQPSLRDIVEKNLGKFPKHTGLCKKLFDFKQFEISNVAQSNEDLAELGVQII